MSADSPQLLATKAAEKTLREPIFADFGELGNNCQFLRQIRKGDRKERVDMRATRLFTIWQYRSWRIPLGNTDKAARELVSWRASFAQHSLLTPEVPQGFHGLAYPLDLLWSSFRNIVAHETRLISYLPWNQSLQISHSIINRLTSYGCRQTQYSWAVAIFGLSPNNAAKLGSGWAGIPCNYAETTQRGTQLTKKERRRRERALTSCVNKKRDTPQRFTIT